MKAGDCLLELGNFYNFEPKREWEKEGIIATEATGIEIGVKRSDGTWKNWVNM